MAQLSVKVTENGINLDLVSLRELGVQAGDDVMLSVTTRPDAEAIRNLALHHTWRKIGNAVSVGIPQWTGEEWTVALWLRDHPGNQGQLVFHVDGTLDEVRSTTKAQLLETPSAGCTLHSAA